MTAARATLRFALVVLVAVFLTLTALTALTALGGGDGSTEARKTGRTVDVQASGVAR